MNFGSGPHGNGLAFLAGEAEAFPDKCIEIDVLAKISTPPLEPDARYVLESFHSKLREFLAKEGRLATNASRPLDPPSMGRNAPEEHPTFFPEATGFRAWLDANHTLVDCLWVGYYKKATGKLSVTWEDTVAEALCYGWIDGIRKSRDDESFVIRFTPRKPRSVWSKRNIHLMERLIAQGRVTPAGMAAFAYKDIHPDSGYRAADLTAELTAQMIERFKAHPRAWHFYQAQPPGYRRNAARWVMEAKRDETRQRRFATLIDDSGNQVRLKQFRKA